MEFPITEERAIRSILMKSIVSNRVRNDGRRGILTSVDNAGARLVVFLLGAPQVLEGAEGGYKVQEVSRVQ